MITQNDENLCFFADSGLQPESFDNVLVQSCRLNQHWGYIRNCTHRPLPSIILLPSNLLKIKWIIDLDHRSGQIVITDLFPRFWEGLPYDNSEMYGPFFGLIWKTGFLFSEIIIAFQNWVWYSVILWIVLPAVRPSFWCFCFQCFKIKCVPWLSGIERPAESVRRLREACGTLFILEVQYESNPVYSHIPFVFVSAPRLCH